MTKNYKQHPIKRNRDENGHILTYTVLNPQYTKFGKLNPLEYNTLKEARLMAIILED